MGHGGGAGGKGWAELKGGGDTCSEPRPGAPRRYPDCRETLFSCSLVLLLSSSPLWGGEEGQTLHWSPPPGTPAAIHSLSSPKPRLTVFRTAEGWLVALVPEPIQSKTQGTVLGASKLSGRGRGKWGPGTVLPICLNTHGAAQSQKPPDKVGGLPRRGAWRGHLAEI